MTNKTVLVTGASGFIGRNVVNYFSKRDWKVFGLGKKRRNIQGSNQGGITWWVQNEVSTEALERFGEVPSLIVHCAGSGSVGFSEENPRADFEANVSSLLPVLEFMRLKCPKSRLVYPSSAAVYGEKGNIPIKENTSLNPISPYGYHKKIAEELCESYSHNFGLNFSIIRFFSIYGPGLRKQLLWDACEKIGNSDGKIEFFGTGEETRDWIHIEDALDLIYKVSESNKIFEIINGGSGEGIKVKKVVDVLLGQFGKELRVFFNGEKRAGDPKCYLADISKAEKLGWFPKMKIEQGLRDYVNFYKTNI